MTARYLGLLAAVAAALLAATPALTCGLEDCALPEAFHRDDPRLSPPADAFSWMNHDLAAARTALRHGERAAALTEGLALGRSLEARGDELVALRGVTRTLALHASIDDLVRSAGGWGLEPLELPGEALAARSQHP